MRNLLVSVIIPVFNRKHFIAEAIQSIIDQDYKPIEIIVVDDGSTDGTAEIIKRFKTIKIITQKNLGVSAARNTGLVSSSGEFIAFLDSDDLCMPRRLKTCVDHFVKYPETDYILGQQQMFLEENVTKPTQIDPEWLIKPQEASNTAVLFAKKNCFEIAGNFNTNYISGEDTEWLFRANDTKLKLARLPYVMIRRRIHTSNLSIEHKKNDNSLLLRILRDSVKRKTQ